jgi:hypothetical protein
MSTLAIIDFDDTIFPTTCFIGENFETFPFPVTEDNQVVTGTLPPPAISAIWQKYLEKVAWSVDLLLKNLRRISDHIVFVTNSSPGWINVVMQHYLPELMPVLAGIPQYHCRHRFPGSEFPKHHATLSLLEIYQPTHIIGIGDQYDDYRAILDICRPLAETRFIKVPLAASPAGFLNHLTQISHYLMTFLYTPAGNHIFIELQEKAPIALEFHESFESR